MNRDSAEPLGPLADRWAKVSSQFPDKRAIVSDDTRLSFRQLDVLVARRVVILQRRGLSPRDRVALVLPTTHVSVAWFLASLEAGCVPLVLDPTLTPSEIETILSRALVRWLVTEQGIECRRSSPVTGLDSLDGGELRASSDTSSETPDVSRDLRSRAKSFEPIDVPADPPTILFHTSGSTGLPVVIEHSQRALLQRIPKPTEMPVCWLSMLGIYSMAGYTLLSQSLLCGHGLVIARKFHPRETLEAIERERVAIVGTTPAALRLMLRAARAHTYDLSSLLVIGVGGSPVSRDLVESTQEQFGCDVVVAYGLTETAGPVALAEGRRIAIGDGHIGAPLGSWEMEVVREDGSPAGAGEPGELLCRQCPDGNETSSQWVRTGDLAVRLPTGDYQIVGRRNDFVDRAGHKVAVVEVEKALETHHAVQRAAVVGVPSPHLGEEDLWAFVVLQPDEERPTSQELTRFCRGRLAPFKIPIHIALCDYLPLTGEGKIRRHHLRDMAIRQYRTQQLEFLRTAPRIANRLADPPGPSETENAR